MVTQELADVELLLGLSPHLRLVLYCLIAFLEDLDTDKLAVVTDFPSEVYLGVESVSDLLGCLNSGVASLGLLLLPRLFFHN